MSESPTNKVSAKRQQLYGRFMAVFTLFFLLIFTFISYRFTYNINQKNEQQKFQNQSIAIQNAITNRMDIYQNSLRGAAGLFAGSNSVERSEWKAYESRIDIQKNYPGIQALGYSEIIPADKLKKHIDTVRAEGFPNYTVFPAGERDVYSSIVYIEPFDIKNQRAFGYDMLTETNRKSAMDRARDTGTLSLSGKVTLLQEDGTRTQPGFLVYLPVYKNGKPSDTVQEKRLNIQGYVYAPFRSYDLINGISNIDASNLYYALYDGDSTHAYKDEYQLFSNLNNVPGNASFESTTTIEIAGHPWTFVFKRLTTATSSDLNNLFPLITLFGGLIISLFIFMTLYFVLTSRAEAFTIAENMTKDLAVQKSKTEAILLGIGDGLIATDLSGKIIFVNQSFTDILGFSSAEVLGKPLTKILIMTTREGVVIPEDDRLISKSLKQKTSATSSSLKTVYYLNKKGGSIPVSITVAPILSDDEVVGAVEIFRDITKETKVDQAKTEFVSLASHQLRTPLTSVSWYTEMLLNGDAGKLTTEQKDFLTSIYEGNKRMIRLVNDLLNVSRIDLGTFMVNPEEVSIDTVADSVLTELTPAFRAKKLKLIKAYPDVLPVIKADLKLVRIILDNLISNAVKYTPENGKIAISINISKKELVVSVSDTGYGIPTSQQDRIYSKMFRADNAQALDSEGTGLGLYLVKAISDETGGRTWFESTENKGSTFYVTFLLSGMKKRAGTKNLT